jgi:hypothetical protein
VCAVASSSVVPASAKLLRAVLVYSSQSTESESSL